MTLVQMRPPEVGLRAGDPVKTFYETLEVSPRASDFVIRAAYRCLAHHHLADKRPDTEGDGQRLANLRPFGFRLLDRTCRDGQP